ncbi:NAD-dependent epimerase/dehydratase family protein [Pinibacter soli]|uniref:Epimerase n=1 Tax=Pinibacter soli TaxID=3044211 RepID=A0ABT6REU4_9BACT|nr:NAD-dependent epimerase/dehydratase family protein [Pinibacter soli]MDI3321043.1 epimerase [Pinibacter soli]
MSLKIILTGATGLVGEGVLLECLAHPAVSEILIISRRPYPGVRNGKIKELILHDFFDIHNVREQLNGYNACFYCAGISSRGLNEQQYSRITYDTVMVFANELLRANPSMVFCHISGSHTDSSEKGKIMWARVKGKAENALMKLPFRKIYNFRPGLMKPTEGQQNIKGYYKIIAALFPVFKVLFPKNSNTIHELALAMINSATKGYEKSILEVSDIKELARQ